jgi:3-deoxy-manno-octulosonate cytidylyltransferase (CMP-KDO synthetase)
VVLKASGGGRVLVVIPARYASRRLPGKVLLHLAGKPMVEHVWRSATEANLGRVVVATDDARVAEVARSFGAEVAMTSPDHRSGSDRVAQVAARSDEDLVLNIQADEPLIRPSSLQLAVRALKDCPQAHLSTLARPIDGPQIVAEPSVVKVVLDEDGFAADFCRVGCPTSLRVWEHIGVYCYRRAALLLLSKSISAPGERESDLEQLRAMGLGFRIRVGLTDDPCVGVNTAEELKTARRLMERRAAPPHNPGLEPPA